ncbi:MAG: hypothetical protein IJE05_02950 [Clostridia bacterium]|nr:hypothetical protein [Clostridia bacterium]
MKKKKKFVFFIRYMLIVVFSLILIYSVFELLTNIFVNGYEIIVTDSNREDINKMIEKYYSQPNEITTSEKLNAIL